MKPFASGGARPFLAEHPEDEYNKNVMYTDYLWDAAEKKGDPTLMARLLTALEFRTEKEPEPFRMVLGTVHRNLQSIGATQALMKLMSAMSKMAMLDTEMAAPEANIKDLPFKEKYVLQEEVPEEVDFLADTSMGITARHRQMWTFRDDFKEVAALSDEQENRVAASFPTWTTVRKAETKLAEEAATAKAKAAAKAEDKPAVKQGALVDMGTRVDRAVKASGGGTRRRT